MIKPCAGRTGRFGRKGISINFVHDKRTWGYMEEIEKATGKPIIRIETNDLDEMEEVRCQSNFYSRPFFPCCLRLLSTRAAYSHEIMLLISNILKFPYHTLFPSRLCLVNYAYER